MALETRDARDFRALILVGAASSGAPKLKKLNGKDHLVVPVVALMEGVIHAVNSDEPEFVPASRLAAAAATWNGRPLVIKHPVRNGIQVSANDPDIVCAQGFGTIYNSKMSGSKLGMEAWVDPDRLEALGEHAMLADIRAGKPIEVSVGAHVRTLASDGQWNGKQYKRAWDDILGDHLAFLPGGRGACSIDMGCGACRAAQAYEVTDTELRALWNPDQARDDHGRFSGGGGSDAKAVSDAAESASDKANDRKSRKLTYQQQADLHSDATIAHSKAADARMEAAKLVEQAADRGEIDPRQAGIDSFYHRTVAEYHRKRADDHTKASGIFATIVPEPISGPMEGFRPIDKKKLKGLSMSALGDRLVEFLRSAGFASSQEEWAPRILAAKSDQSFENRISVAQDAVQKKFGHSGYGLMPSSAWCSSTHEDHLIVTKDSKYFSVPIKWVDGQVEFTGEPSEVKMAYVAAEDFEVLRAAAGARNSASDKKHIQAAHDSLVSLGAACDRKNAMRIMGAKYEDCASCGGSGEKNGNPCEACEGNGEIEVKKQQRSACGKCPTGAEEPCKCGGHSAQGEKEMKNKTERIAALMASEHNLVKDQKALEAITDESVLVALETHVETQTKLKAAEAATAAEKKRADEAEVALKAAQAAQIPAEELTELRALASERKAADEAEKTTIIGKLKAAGAFTEDELKAKSVTELRKLAALAKVETPDFSGRGLPRAAATGDKTEDYAPPNAYEAGIKALQQQQTTH